MRFTLSTTLAVATAASGAAAQLSGDQVLKSLNDIVSGLRSAGDARVKLQQATPTINAQTVVAFENALNDAFAPVYNTINENSLGDENNIGDFNDAQQAALCALLPQFTQAGNYAIDTLSKLPTFQDQNGPAFDTEFKFGLTIESLSIGLNSVAWSLHLAGASAKCDSDNFAVLQGLSGSLDDLSNYLLY
ncbi:hypothetical protein NQ176_g1324 [Zarea fungicola]|uniref:Uncharacterized protein n=1 Tax=Zarea fungicola TaxID=93591 RepID=A0ACC1NUC9_9HYPO|nr:hypothetical protein NQ176_g1324 [Lecanicillium fungicola]